MRKYCLFLALLVCTVLRVDAQHPDFWTLNEESGLPSNVVYDIIEDSNGYIWIGTDRGIVRYNGQEFKAYSSSAQKSLALTGLNEDKWGRIWAVNFSKQVFYVVADSLVELPMPTEPNDLGHIKIAHVGNDLYVYSYGNADRLDLETMEWDVDFYGKHWPKASLGPDRKLLYSISGAGQNLALSFSEEIHQVKNNQPSRILPIPKKPGYHRSSWFAGSQVLMAHGFKPILSYSAETGDTTSLQVSHPAHSESTRILVCATDGSDRLWLCTSEGARVLISVAK